jgi:GT2 family glycosyltransferase
MLGMSPKVSVIIVNYNGRHLLEKLFESLAHQTFSADEIILVDNASVDRSVDYVREHFPQVTLITLPTNTGFAGGNNAGFAKAQGEYVALLNSDTVVDKRWLAELVQALDADERVGAAVPKIYLAAEYPRIDQAGAEFNNLGNIWGRGAYQLDHGQFDTAIEVPALTGCSVIIRRQALHGESLFDQRFFMYHEELELTLRLRGRRYSIMYVPTAIVHHKLMQSVRENFPQPRLFQQFYCNRNRSKILTKYYPLSVLIPSLPLIFLNFIYWNWFFLRTGGIIFFLRAVSSQAQYALQGFKERLRSPKVSSENWLPWMKRQGLRELLAVRSTLQERDHNLGQDLPVSK